MDVHPCCSSSVTGSTHNRPKDHAKLRGIRQRLIVIGLSDGNGARIAKATDLDKLPAAVVDELAEAIGDVNGINKKSKDEAGNDSAKTGD